MNRLLSAVASTILMLLCCSQASEAQAESKHFTEIEYDDAGRVKAVRLAVDEQAPTVQQMVPTIVRHGPSRWFEVRGTSLRAADVETDHSGLTVSAITANANAVRFRLQASEDVPLGRHLLTMVTALGSADVQFDVYPRLPVLIVEPNPAVLATDATLALTLRTDVPDVIAHTFNLTGTGVAALGASSLTLPAGSTLLGTVNLQATSSGVGSLRVDTGEIADIVVPVFATPRWQPTLGAKFYSSLLGVRVGDGAGPPQLISRGPFTSLLGVVMPGQVPGATPSSSLTAPLLGVTTGSVAQRVSPDFVVRGAGPATVEVHGVGLTTVHSLAVTPIAGFTASVVSTDADGRRLVVSVTADGTAALGGRELRLLTASGASVPFVTRGAATVRVVDPLPEIDSVSPLLLVRGTNATLSVRGVRLNEVTALRFNPPLGVSVGSSPVVEAGGKRMTVNLNIASDAPLGERGISLVSAAGETSTSATDNNRVHVVGNIAGTVTPVLSPLLGVSVGTTPGGSEQSILQVSAPVGVLVGSVFTRMEPSAKSIDSQFTLRVQGVGLSSVMGLAFEPAPGVTVSNVAPSPDGTSVTAEVSIAPTAARGLRRVRLLAPSGSIAPVSPAVALFRVTEQLPEIESLTPLSVVPGTGPVTLKVRGRNLADVTGIRLQPAQGTTTTALAVAADGKSLTATLIVTSDAALGERAVVLDAPTGSSDDSPSSANRVILASSISPVYTPLLSPLVGIQVGQAPAPTPTTVGLVSPLLGVQVGNPPATAPASYFVTGSPLGVAIGPVATVLSPQYLPVGRSAQMRIEGFRLAGVTTVEFLPAEGITSTGPVSVAADGLSVTWPVDVAAGAGQTERRVVLRNTQGEVPFASPLRGLARVVGNEPRIDSIAPIQATPGQTMVLTIRGSSLFGATTVTATPSQGLTFSVNPTVNSAGTEVTVTMTIAADAARGPRVIRVAASGGTTTDESLAANTFTVVTGQ